MSQKKVVGMGEVLWDVFPAGKRLGGAPANFAYHVRQFGLDSCIVSAVGKDQAGAELLRFFENRQMNCLLQQTEFPTGTVQVALDENGIPSYKIMEGVAWDNIQFTDELRQLAGETVAVCFGSLAQRNTVSRCTINCFLDAMPREEGILKVFDINLRQQFYTQTVLLESLQRCNVLKINDEELEVIRQLFGLPFTDVVQTCRCLLDQYRLEILILTCGARGSYVFTPAAVSFLDTPEVQVADTVGAGDSFTASFCAAVLYGKPISEAHRLAVETSAYVCSQCGAMPVLPHALIEKVCR